MASTQIVKDWKYVLLRKSSTMSKLRLSTIWDKLASWLNVHIFPFINNLHHFPQTPQILDTGHHWKPCDGWGCPGTVWSFIAALSHPLPIQSGKAIWESAPAMCLTSGQLVNCDHMSRLICLLDSLPNF